MLEAEQEYDEDEEAGEMSEGEESEQVFREVEEEAEEEVEVDDESNGEKEEANARDQLDAEPLLPEG